MNTDPGSFDIEYQPKEIDGDNMTMYPTLIIFMGASDTNQWWALFTTMLLGRHIFIVNVDFV